MGRFLLRRLGHGAAVIFIAASLSFLLVHLAPGDPFSMSLDSARIDPATITRWRAAYGLDQPLGVQYVRFLGQLAVGNLGPSFATGRPASTVLANAIPRTLLLMGAALVLSFVAGVALGAWQAVRRGSAADRVASTTALVLASLPEFWVGVVLVLTLAYRLRLFPAGGMVDVAMHDSMSVVGRIADIAHHLVLPALTLALVGTASIARYQRAALLETLPQDFVRTARAKGVSERVVLWRHALRNALVPTVVLLGLSLPALAGGTVFVEQVFSWQGMGWTASSAFANRDYPVVIGATVAGAVLVVLGGILTDVLHAAIDPRVRRA